MKKMNFNGQEKSEVTNAIKNAIKAAMMLANTNDCDYGESKLDSEIFGGNWKVYVTNDESEYTFGLYYGLLCNNDFSVCVDINSLMDYELMCGDFIDSVCNKFYDYLVSNIDSEKVKTIVTAVFKGTDIVVNNAYIGKGWELDWLKNKDEKGKDFVAFTLCHNGYKAYGLGTYRLGRISLKNNVDAIAETACTFINN